MVNVRVEDDVWAAVKALAAEQRRAATPQLDMVLRRALGLEVSDASADVAVPAKRASVESVDAGGQDEKRDHAGEGVSEVPGVAGGAQRVNLPPKLASQVTTASALPVVYGPHDYTPTSVGVCKVCGGRRGACKR